MEIIPNKNKSQVSKPQQELVQKEKQEYKLIGSFLRTKGLKLFSYNLLKSEIEEVEIGYKNTAIVSFEESEQVKSAPMEARVDTKNIHFEALNLRTAKERVSKWKSGKIKDLCNLKKPLSGSISIF